MTHPDGVGTAPNDTAKNITYIEGHGEFKASASLRSRQDVDYDGHQPYNAFDYAGVNGNLDYTSGSFLIYGPGSGESVGYNKTTGYFEDNNYQLSASSGTPYGHWLQLEMPYKINIKSYFIEHVADDYWPQDWQIWASNDDNNWTHIHTYIGGTYDNDPQYYTVAHTGHYKIYTMIVTRIKEGSSLDRLRIQELRYFGTPGPTTLDKGSLTLGRSLDVPRISRYDVDTETPRPEKLLIDYDTTVNSSLTDISGQGNHGRFFSDAQYSAADKAFKFDGTDDYTQTPITIAGGNMAWTQSLWFKVTAFLGSGVYSVLSFFGNKSGLSGIITSYKAGNMWQDWYGNGVYFDYTFEVGQWYHSVSVYHGNTSTDPNVRSSMYINGVKQTLTFYSAISSPMTLPTSTFYELADHINASNTRHNGLISNVKLYNVALEASEVQKLYRLGRTGRSMVISDTAVGIGKVPEAQLDVRGTIGIDNILWRGGDWSHPLLPEAEFYWNPQSYISKPFSNGTTAGSTITDINGKLNGIQGNTGWHNNWWAPVTSASYIETLGNVDLTRDWTIVMWNKSTAGSTRLAGHGAMEPSKGFHLANSGTNKIRFGFYGNDIDTDSDYYTHSNTWCQYAATYYHGTGATHNRQLFQNERNILDMRAGRHDSGTPPTSTNYAASTDLGDQRLRFGTSYGSGNYANLANKYGPIAFFGRVLSAGEIRSLYNYFRITWQPGGDDLA
jgi:hypothetical protein